jgi:hypothetical protein
MGAGQLLRTSKALALNVSAAAVSPSRSCLDTVLCSKMMVKCAGACVGVLFGTEMMARHLRGFALRQGAQCKYNSTMGSVQAG